MLTAHYQIFLMLLARKSLTKAEVKVFGTAKSFYKMTSYLIRNDLVSAEALPGNKKCYSLTMRGEIIANILFSLDDNDKINLDKYMVSPFEKMWS